MAHLKMFLNLNRLMRPTTDLLRNLLIVLIRMVLELRLCFFYIGLSIYCLLTFIKNWAKLLGWICCTREYFYVPHLNNY